MRGDPIQMYKIKSLVDHMMLIKTSIHDHMFYKFKSFLNHIINFYILSGTYTLRHIYEFNVRVQIRNF